MLAKRGYSSDIGEFGNGCDSSAVIAIFIPQFLRFNILSIDPLQ
jgi:hypothetical protein